MDTGTINIQNLPPEAQKHLFEYWEFLSQKYSSQQTSGNSPANSEETRIFLDTLNKLSFSIPKHKIQSPEKWQKEIRQDRDLPGRDT